MSLQKKVLLGVGIALVLGVLGLFLPASKTVVDSTKVDVNAIAQQVFEVVQNQLPDNFGASSAPAVVNGCQDIEGVITCFRSMTLTPATSTPCRLVGPSATSTLVRTSLRIAVGSSTASAWHVSTTTGSQWATTTPNYLGNIIGIPLASAKQGSIVLYATSTSAATTGFTGPDSANVIVPNGVVVWSGAGYLPADTSKFLGRCEAVFQVI